MLVSTTTTRLAQLGALSSNGRSKTFDASADGYGRGDACIVFVACHQIAGQQPLVIMHGKAFKQEAGSRALLGHAAMDSLTAMY